MSLANPSAMLYMNQLQRGDGIRGPTMDVHGVSGSRAWTVDTVVIPEWVSQALTVNKLSAIDILDYVKLRKIMSLTDLARFCAVGGVEMSPLLRFPYRSNCWTLENRWHERGSLKGDLLTEFQATIRPAAFAEATSRDVVSGLTDMSEDLDAMTMRVQDYYDIQVVQEKTIFIFMKCGIVNALDVRANAKIFISDYVRALYSLSPIHEVSLTSEFKDYLGLL